MTMKQLAIRVDGKHLVTVDEHGAAGGIGIPVEAVTALELCPIDKNRIGGDWTIIVHTRALAPRATPHRES